MRSTKDVLIESMDESLEQHKRTIATYKQLVAAKDRLTDILNGAITRRDERIASLETMGATAQKLIELLLAKCEGKDVLLTQAQATIAKQAATLAEWERLHGDDDQPF